MPHKNIIYLHLTHPFHSVETSIHKPTSHVQQQSWQTDGKEPSKLCRRRHPLTPMATNSNATKVLRLLYFYFFVFLEGNGCFAGTNHSWDVLLCGFEKKRRGSSVRKERNLPIYKISISIF